MKRASDEQEKRVLAYVRDMGWATPAEVGYELGISVKRAQETLIGLVLKRVLMSNAMVTTTDGRGRRCYELLPASAEA